MAQPPRSPRTPRRETSKKNRWKKYAAEDHVKMVAISQSSSFLFILGFLGGLGG
jgi:hypothetical protein